MKKYLMTGMAALAICAAFTSCSKETNVYNPDVIKENATQTIINNYNEAFIKTFGQPASNQNWGFIDYSSKARTRATGEFANHVGAYPDANMWTSKGFYAPDPLTHAQKLRAQYYFQMTNITNPYRPDYGTKDYFMQQVYDGGTDPMAGKSAEKYLAADETTLIESGEHMDHLTSGTGHLHIYNFNNGTCSTNDNVADRDQTDVNNTSQQHSDEIQLMLNTPTSCFGYANSDASCVRDDRWTLVSAATIDAFCDGDTNFQTWLSSKLLEGEVDKKCDDDFHRDFIGFDFDMLPDEHIFSGTEIWENGDASNGWQQVYKGKTYSEWDYYRYDLYGAKYHYVSANRNQYCGESQTIDPEPSQERALELISEGWLPASGSANKTWVNVGGCADGYYSDWIVTFMPATYTPDPEPEWDLRIICEDLNATATAADPEDSDWDFNDLVLDVKFLGSDKVKMRVYAAGATLPIRINGEDALEVHGLYHQPTNIMINTGAAAAGYPNQAYESNGVYPEFERTITGVDDAYGANIKIEVEKGAGNWVELFAKPGQPASKMGVMPDYTPCTEREDITGRYSNFVAWVAKVNPVFWWRPISNNE